MDGRLLVGCVGIINLVYTFHDIQSSTIFKQTVDLTYRPFLQIFPKASSEAEDLLRRLLHFNPYKRLTAEVDILNLHNYIAKCFIKDVLYRHYKDHTPLRLVLCERGIDFGCHNMNQPKIYFVMTKSQWQRHVKACSKNYILSRKQLHNIVHLT